MTTYNGGKYLSQQLESFCRQTRLPDELIVCDDGSTDETLDILEAFRRDAPFAVIVSRNSVNLGFTKNFELALSKCSGEVVFLSDQDDVWFPDKIARVAQLFDDNPGKLLLIHDGALVEDEKAQAKVTKLAQVRSGFGSDDHAATGALTALRREFMVTALPIPDGIVGHDIWLHGLATLLDTRLVLRESLQIIRRHSTNTSEWIAASLHPIGRMDVWRYHYQTPVAKDYSDRVRINDSLRERLLPLVTTSDVFPCETVERGLATLALERQALADRTKLIGLTPLKRRLFALRLLLAGRYRYFNGLASFGRDILR